MSVPKIDLKFKAGRVTSKKLSVISILPVFSDQEPATVARILEKPEMQEKIIQLRKTGAFRGARGEIMNLALEGTILCGLGKRKTFHPDSSSAMFRGLGARMVKYREVVFNVIFSEELQEVVKRYDSIARGENVPEEEAAETRASKKAALKSAPGAGKAKDNDAEAGTAGDADEAEASDTGEDDEGTQEETLPDYTGPLSLEELISQAVSCMIIGSDSMDLLKKERTNRTLKIGTIGIVASSLPAARVQEAVERGQAVGRMVNGVRHVAALPGNRFNPEEAERYARELAREFKLKIHVHDEQKLEKGGFGGILAVGRGSRVPPRMIVLEYKHPKPARKGRIALIGKGITFDSGGISLKPGPEMHEMKYDMCGAALVLHMMALLAERKMPVDVVGLIALAENLPDGNATKPGDVYTAYNGLTVEVQNTDAEGRLLLGDLLAHAAKTYTPSCMIDFATLTGACVIALGHEASGLMTASEDLASRLELASRKSLDRTWRLPHWQAYSEPLKSDIADMRNIGGRPAGSVTAMRFLSKFVPPSVPWAHIDIAGTAWRSKPMGGQCKGATGWGVRMMNQFFEDLVGE